MARTDSRTAQLLALDRKNNPVRSARLRRGWSLRKLARSSRLHFQTIWQIEVGRRKPRPRSVSRLAQSLRLCPVRLVWKLHRWRTGRDPEDLSAFQSASGTYVRIWWGRLDQGFLKELVDLMTWGNPVSDEEGRRLYMRVMRSRVGLNLLFPWTRPSWSRKSDRRRPLTLGGG